MSIERELKKDFTLKLRDLRFPTSLDQISLIVCHLSAGMTTNQFVEQSPYYYSQMESYGFAHVILEELYSMHDYGKLQVYFNGLFDDMYAAKEREVNLIRERNERIRYIDSELRIMFGQSLPQVPVDPQWHPKVNTCEYCFYREAMVLIKLLRDKRIDILANKLEKLE